MGSLSVCPNGLDGQQLVRIGQTPSACSAPSRTDPASARLTPHRRATVDWTELAADLETVTPQKRMLASFDVSRYAGRTSSSPRSRTGWRRVEPWPRPCGRDRCRADGDTCEAPASGACASPPGAANPRGSAPGRPPFGPADRACVHRANSGHLGSFRRDGARPESAASPDCRHGHPGTPSVGPDPAPQELTGPTRFVRALPTVGIHRLIAHLALFVLDLEDRLFRRLLEHHQRCGGSGYSP